MLKLEELINGASQSIGAKRVFGEPYEKNGVTVIPAARVMGGAGGGEGTQPATDDEPGVERGAAPSGYGAGYGISGGPAGAFVIKGDEVSWVPAIDVNRLMLGFQVVMIVFFLVIRSVMKGRAKAMLEAAKSH
ncbi:MAG TPA: spore germination protein GerW family protein [Candidatus Limnocylindrales bacterium]|nr:spore germination protein GerW family protein [Candidatus Limnocylindrales bacterium]